MGFFLPSGEEESTSRPSGWASYLHSWSGLRWDNGNAESLNTFHSCKKRNLNVEEQSVGVVALNYRFLFLCVIFSFLGSSKKEALGNSERLSYIMLWQQWTIPLVYVKADDQKYNEKWQINCKLLGNRIWQTCDGSFDIDLKTWSNTVTGITRLKAFWSVYSFFHVFLSAC